LKYGLFALLKFIISTGRTKSPGPNTSSQDSLTTVNTRKDNLQICCLKNILGQPFHPLAYSCFTKENASSVAKVFGCHALPFFTGNQLAKVEKINE
jgi:hypothetical protein